jgi:UrcA family protein
MSTTNTISILQRFIASAIVGTLALGAAAVSTAADSSDVRTITVKFGDLNISNPEGAAKLYNRIRAAAESVCSDSDADIWVKASVNRCIHKAIADAVMKVNQPALFVVYNQHNKTPLPTTLLSQSR